MVCSPYSRIEAISEELTRSPATFSGLLAPEPRMVSSNFWSLLKERYALIQTWQQTSARLLAESIRGDLPPTIASSLLDHLPDYFGWKHHTQLNWRSISPPVYFRTDQAGDGTIFEVQCPGSLSGMYEILHA